MNSTLKNRYAQLTDLALVVRSSQRMIGKALKHGLKTPHLTQSYLILALCVKEYCYSTNLAIDRFGSDEFETILAYYHRLVREHPDRNLLIFTLSEVKPILAKVGGDIRSIVSMVEISIGLTN
jgi:hypothetical protein